MSKKSHAYQQKKSKKFKNRKVSEAVNEPKITVVRSPFLVPERMRIPLVYKSSFVLNDNTSRFAFTRFRPSSIYDVDPLTGGGSFYGFSEWTKFYGKYRTHSSQITVKAVNRDSEAAVPFVLPVAVDPGTSISEPYKYYMNNIARSEILGAYTAQSKCVLKHRTTTKAITGVSERADDPYTALISANPTENWYWLIGTHYIGGGTYMTYGLAVEVKIEAHVDLFDRLVLSDPAYLGGRDPRTNVGSDYPPPVPVYLVQPGKQ